MKITFVSLCLCLMISCLPAQTDLKINYGFIETLGLGAEFVLSPRLSIETRFAYWQDRNEFSLGGESTVNIKRRISGYIMGRWYLSRKKICSGFFAAAFLGTIRLIDDYPDANTFNSLQSEYFVDRSIPIYEHYHHWAPGLLFGYKQSFQFGLQVELLCGLGFSPEKWIRIREVYWPDEVRAYHFEDSMSPFGAINRIFPTIQASVGYRLGT